MVANLNYPVAFSVVATCTVLEQLKSLRFLSMGYLKNRVQCNNPETIRDLKTTITVAIKAFSRGKCGMIIEPLLV